MEVVFHAVIFDCPSFGFAKDAGLAPALARTVPLRERGGHCLITCEKLGGLHTFECAMAKKTPEQKAAEALRYDAARAATNVAELEPFLTDANQAIRVVASMNPAADAALLDRFADDKFWGVRIQIVGHPNISQATLRKLLEANTRKRGVVHHAAREKLEELGVAFGADGMPEDSGA